MLKIKDNVNMEVLRNYGFLKGKEWADRGEKCLDGILYKYKHDWYHKFVMDEEYPDKIQYGDYDNPVATIYVKDNRYICFNVEDSYYNEDLVLDSLFDMINDGIVEKL